MESGIITTDSEGEIQDSGEMYQPAQNELLAPPQVAIVPPYITREEPNPVNPNPPVRAATRGTARVNDNIRTPRPRNFEATVTTSTASEDVGGTNLHITDVRSVSDWENIPNESDSLEYLVFYQEGDDVVAQWESFPPL